MSEQEFVDVAIAMFLLVGVFVVMFWDRREWKKDKRAAEEEERK